jgi:hypothetical protein
MHQGQAVSPTNQTVKASIQDEISLHRPYMQSLCGSHTGIDFEWGCVARAYFQLPGHGSDGRTR